MEMSTLKVPILTFFKLHAGKYEFFKRYRMQAFVHSIFKNIYSVSNYFTATIIISKFTSVRYINPTPFYISS